MSQSIDETHKMLLLITQSMMDRPEDIRIEHVHDGESILFRVQIHPEDTGILIGANGRTVRALRVLLNANAIKLKLRISLTVASLEER